MEYEAKITKGVSGAREGCEMVQTGEGGRKGKITSFCYGWRCQQTHTRRSSNWA